MDELRAAYSEYYTEAESVAWSSVSAAKAKAEMKAAKADPVIPRNPSLSQRTRRILRLRAHAGPSRAPAQDAQEDRARDRPSPRGADRRAHQARRGDLDPSAAASHSFLCARLAAW